MIVFVIAVIEIGLIFSAIYSDIRYIDEHETYWKAGSKSKCKIRKNI